MFQSADPLAEAAAASATLRTAGGTDADILNTCAKVLPLRVSTIAARTVAVHSPQPRSSVFRHLAHRARCGLTVQSQLVQIAWRMHKSRKVFMEASASTLVQARRTRVHVN